MYDAKNSDEAKAKMHTTAVFPDGDWILLGHGAVSRSTANPFLHEVSLNFGQVDFVQSEVAPKAFILINMPVSLLPCMKVGTIWRNGISVSTLVGSARTRKYRGIGTATVSGFIKLFAGTDVQTAPASGLPGSVVVKPTHFPWDFLQQSKDGQNAIEVSACDSCTGQPVALVIPCWEILRFYFCTSPILSQEIFRYGLTPTNNLYVEKMSRVVGGCSRLLLRGNIPSSDGNTVLRIAFDETADREARRCALGIYSQFLSDVPAYPKVGLPFSGTSELTCLTERCETIDGKTIDFVLQIESCTAPFPKSEVGWRGFREVGLLLRELKNRPETPGASKSGKREFTDKVLTNIKEIVSGGVETLSEVAKCLNMRGIPSPKGKKWRGPSVHSLILHAARPTKETQSGRGYRVHVRQQL
jgi:hypothetical protein